MKTAALVISMALALSACGDLGETTNETTSGNSNVHEEVDDVGVDWENHHPRVKRRIDRMAKNKNCDSLQNEFDIADANDTNQRNRTGDGNADLMEYIDKQMDMAGCYGRG